MFSITANKIAGLTPRWARFPGFSLLFDPRGLAFREVNGLRVLDGNVADDPSLALFSLVTQGVMDLNPDRLLQTYGFCALPFPSYHVTAFDVANRSDLERCRADSRDVIKATLDELPSATAFEADFLVPARECELVRQDWNLAFGYGALRNWGSVLAIELSPLDPDRYFEFLEARSRVCCCYQETHSVGGDEFFTPHVSLGYFMNREGAELAAGRIADWDDRLRDTIGNATITFSTVSLYGFTDMATFFKP